LLIAHPECETEILKLADFVGSTSQMLRFTEESAAQKFIVATETGIMHQMEQKSPHKIFIPAPPDNACACNDCPHMKRNTIEKLYLSLLYEQPEITMDEELRIAAKKPIDKMLEMSQKLGIL
jgi:quinolinate synthase